MLSRDFKTEKIMLSRDVAKNLCAYDKRNPDSAILDEDDIKEHDFSKGCFCDNCFYGRTILAKEILRLTSRLAKT